MARGEQILRHWNLLRMLQTRGTGLPLRAIAAELGVTERTIQRDFEALEEVGFPLEHQEDEYGKRYWRLPHDFFRSGPLVLGLTEAVSLHLAEHLLRPLAGTHFAEGLASLLEKIRALIPARALEYFRELDDVLHVRRAGFTDYAEQADIIRLLSDAAREARTVEVTYRALWRGVDYTTRLDPYGLVLYDDDLFVVGRSHRAAALRVFKVNRITAAAPTAGTFERPADFRLEEHFRGSFGIFHGAGPPVEIVVRFSGPVAELIEERVWHESQQLRRQPGEATLFDPSPEDADVLIATFRLSNVVEFKRWLKGYGEFAEVVRPAWLRAELRAELLAAAARHAD